MQSTNVNSIIKTTSLRHCFDDNEFKTLTEQSQTVVFNPGDKVLQQGKKTAGLYIILEGSAIVTAWILGKGQVNLATLAPGNFFGEINLLVKGPAVRSVVAKTKLHCLVLSRECFAMLGLFFPELKYKLTRAIAFQVCERLTDLHTKIKDFMSHSEMASHSVFSDMIKSFSKPTNTTFSDENLDPEKLKHLSLFEEFYSTEFDEIFEHATLIKTGKNCNLILEGEEKFVCYLLLQGAVQCNIVQANKTAKLTVLGPVTLFSSMMSADGNASAILNFTTCERTILWKLNQKQMDLLQTHKPKLWYKLFELLCETFATLERAAYKLDIRLNSELYNR